MIKETLEAIAKELNDTLKRQLTINEDKVIAANIVDQQGNPAVPGENKVILTLINIEKESAASSRQPQPYAHTQSGDFIKTAPPLYLNLYVLFTAYFNNNNYLEAAKFLSYIIEHLQAKNTMDHQNSPHLDEGIERLIFEISTLSYHELSNLWSAIGAKYMPSVIYKVRMLTVSKSAVQEVVDLN